MRIIRHASALQFARYGFVGVGNTAISFVTFSALIAIGTPYVLASGIAFVPAAAASYTGNRGWTFAGAASSHAHAVPRYVVVLLLGLLTDLVLIAALVDGLGVSKLPAQLAVIPAVAVQGYLLSRRWAFADRPMRASARGIRSSDRVGATARATPSEARAESR